MTRMFSLRADSCCCCLSFSSDSFSPVMSLAEVATAKWKHKGNASEEMSNRSASLPPRRELQGGGCTYNIDRHILSPGLGRKPHAVSTWTQAVWRGKIKEIKSFLSELYLGLQQWHTPRAQLLSRQGLHVRFAEANLQGKKDKQVWSNLDMMLSARVNINARPVQLLTFLGRGSSLVIVSLKVKRNKTMANH